MSSEELNQDELNQDELNKDMLLKVFYNTKGNIDDINAAIATKLNITLSIYLDNSIIIFS